MPDELLIEENLPRPIAEALEMRGHKLKVFSALGVSQIVARNSNGAGFVGGADTRAGGAAVGW